MQKYITAFIDHLLAHANWRNKKHASGVVIAMVIVLAFTCGSHLYADTRESQVKAAYIFNFIRYTTFPELQQSTDSISSFRIGILGENPFPESMSIISKKQVQGKNIEIILSDTASKLQSCQIVYVNEIHNGEIKKFIKHSQSHSILLVGEGEEFLQQGGIIAFNVENEQVRFSINQAAAEKSGIRFSAQLMEIARIVRY